MSNNVERQQFIERWTDISRQDNMHKHLTPSDFRIALGHISRANEEIERLREANKHLQIEVNETVKMCRIFIKSREKGLEVLGKALETKDHE